MKYLNYIVFFLLITFNLFSSKNLENSFISFTDDEEIATITSDDEAEFIDAIEQLNMNGGTIYIDTPVINLERRSSISLTGKLPGGIIGIRQSNGEYPRINFVNQYFEELLPGIVIYGSNKFIEYIIIENSPDDGISLLGDNNILDHVISRYNHGSGFNIYGDFNSLNYCYSYRNSDANAYLVTADGFHIFGELNNIFNYCFAWDNANSGFNYVRLFNSSELSYLHSGSWNNGNINVFTGLYDYYNGAPLDKNLWTIQQMMESDPNFVSNYYNKKFTIEHAEIDGIPAQEWVAKVKPKLDGNGFTFGNRNSSQSIDVKRNALYCVAFDNKEGGFIDNFNHRYNAYFRNCASFNNGINYKLPYYTFTKWVDNWSWESENKDQLNKVTAKLPSNNNSLRNLFTSVMSQIETAVNANMFPDGVNFDYSINRLI